MARSLLLIFLLLAGSLAQAETTVKVGYTDEPPFHYVGEGGLIVGFDAEILQHTLRQIGYTALFVEAPWKRTLHDIEEGHMHFGMGSGYNESRTHYAYFSSPYKFIEHSLIVRGGSPNSPTTLVEFLDRKTSLGVVLGWNYPPKLRKIINAHTGPAKVVEVPDFETLLKMLKKGRLGGIIGNMQMIKALDAQNHEPLANYRIIEQFYEPLHYIVSRKLLDDAFMVRFNQALEAFMETQSYTDLRTNYLD